MPYLRRLGVRHLDMVLITHRHADHLRGLIKVAETIPVKELVEGERTPAAYANGQEDDSGYERLVTTALNHGTHLRKVAAGDVFVFGERSRLEILYPGQVDLLDSVDENGRSLVMRLSYGHFSLLLTGDLELRGRPGLPGSHPDLQATILKVPHHGSKEALSPGFLARVRPRVAVITVGRNSFGHPAPNTLALLKSKKVRVYRTDQNGAVIIQTDGHRYRVKSVHR